MMSMHRAMPIDAATAGQWTDAMKRALAQVEVDADLAEALNEVFGRMASGMRAH
jgi:hemoglobin